MKKVTSFLVMFLLVFSFLSFSVFAKGPSPIVLSEREHDSLKVHNYIVSFIIENGYGYKCDTVITSTPISMAGLLRGDIDVSMEVWVENQQEAYDKCIKNGILDLGSNYSDSWQGWLIPRYTAKKYNIKSVFDMKDHWKLFKDPETPDLGRFYSCIPGWFCSVINEKKIKAYGLDKKYDVFLPGSGASLAGSLVSSIKRHKPWFGYYWAPTWILGKYDLYKLEEPEYRKEVWENGYKCGFPSVNVNIMVNPRMVKDYPDVVEFLKNYETTQEINNKFLAYQMEIDGSNRDSALWFLRNYRERWHKWVPENIVEKVENKL